MREHFGVKVNINSNTSLDSVSDPVLVPKWARSCKVQAHDGVAWGVAQVALYETLIASDPVVGGDSDWEDTGDALAGTGIDTDERDIRFAYAVRLRCIVVDGGSGTNIANFTIVFTDMEAPAVP